MTESRTDSQQHDYLPAAGRDAFLPIYDLLTRVLGAPGVHRAILDRAGIAAGHRVIEIGCGTGNLTLMAARAHPDAEIVGTDPDPKALARAERKAHGMNGIRFERAYAQQLPHEDGSADRVLSALMLHHLDATTKAALAEEALRVLRPGGALHLADIGGPMSTADGAAARYYLRGEHLAGNLGDRVPELLREAGFDIVDVRSHPHRRLGRVIHVHAERPR